MIEELLLYGKYLLINGTNLFFKNFENLSNKEKIYAKLYEKYEKNFDVRPIMSVAPFYYYKTIFIHVPKTGGISVCNSLFNSNGCAHKSVIDYEKEFGKNLFDRYFKFSIVRNPWDRALSAFFYIKGGGGITLESKKWVEKNITCHQNFNSFIKNSFNEEIMENQVHFQSQSKFILNSKNEISLNYLGKYENLENNYSYVATILGINTNERPLKHLNKSLDRKKSDFKHYYTDDSIEIIAKYYTQDIELFGYEY